MDYPTLTQLCHFPTDNTNSTQNLPRGNSSDVFLVGIQFNVLSQQTWMYWYTTRHEQGIQRLEFANYPSPHSCDQGFLGPGWPSSVSLLYLRPSVAPTSDATTLFAVNISCNPLTVIVFLASSAFSGHMTVDDITSRHWSVEYQTGSLAIYF